MCFNISGFKGAFLNQLREAANLETYNNKIDTKEEKDKAGEAVSTFKSHLANMSVLIGDTVSFSPHKISVDDLLAYVDPKIADKVKNYTVTKPVETIKLGKTPSVASKMAGMVQDVDIDKLNAFLDMAYRSEVAERIAENVEQSPEDMETAYYVGLAYEE